MYVRNTIFTIIFLLSAINCFSQTFAYSYADPCTGVVKTLQVPSNGITVTYYGQIRTFQASDFNNGVFDNWTQGVYSSFGGNSPCASVVGLPVSINVAQSSAINLISITYSISAISDLQGPGSSNLISGNINSVSNSSGAGKGKDKKNKTKSIAGSSTQPGGSTDKNNSGNNGSTVTNNNGSQNSSNDPKTLSEVKPGVAPGSTTPKEPPLPGSSPGSAGSTTTKDGSSTGTSNPPNTSSTTPKDGSNPNPGNSSGANGTAPNDPQKPAEDGGGSKTNLMGGNVNALSNLQSSDSKNGNRPTVIASSDFVGFNFKSGDVSVGGKFTGGYTSMRWDGMRTHGILVDYTTATKGPNITGFYGWIKRKHTDLLATTLTVGFENRMSVYLTVAYGQLWNLNKRKDFKSVMMLSSSYGKVYGETFVGTAAIAGCMYDWRVSKRYQIKLMGLYVYSPYVSYFNDMLLKSQHVIIPIIGTNIAITKRFKININTGGAWAIGDNALNYTVMMGTRLML